MQVTVREGSVSIYGSTNSQASSVLNEFQRVATVSRSMSFYVKGKNAISLAFVSNMPTSCKTNFQVQVNQGVNLTPGEKKRSGILKTAFTFKLMGQIIMC